MKKVKKAIMTLLPSFFIVGMVLSLSSCESKKGSLIEDTAIYSKDDGVKNYNTPDFTYNAVDDDDDEDEKVAQPGKVILHYYNENGVTGSTIGSQRAFYIWATGVDGIEINRNENSEYYSVDEKGTMMTLTIDFSLPLFSEYRKNSLMFIIKYEKKSNSDLNWGGQSEDMQLSYRAFPPTGGEGGVTEVWTMPSAGGGIAILDSYNKTQVHGIRQAEFTDWKTIHCEVTDNTHSVNWKLYAFDETYYKVKAKKRADIQKWYLVEEGSGSGARFDIKLKYPIHTNVVYSLVSHDPASDSDIDMKDLDKTTPVSFENLYYTNEFHTYYEAPNADKTLGMTYNHPTGDKPESVTIRVWAPTAGNMSVLLYDDGTPTEFKDATHSGDDKAQGYHMSYKSGGIWEVTIVNEDNSNPLKGKYYNIQVDNSLGTNVTMDPYATSAGISGQRAYIYDKDELKPEGWDQFDVGSIDPKDLSIYEIHIQDLTSDESWVSHNDNKRGTYDAFVESGTTVTVDGKTATTGYDHIKELGVNAIQITPTFDHDNDERPDKMKYNWGYNPLNYNIPEGGYSSDPFDGAARVKEFRNLVLQMSKTPSKTRVIMDVVYNHVSSASASNFNKLMPRYYFRYARADHTYHWTDDYGNPQTSVVEKGTMWDGSGCNNEVASERAMMRKFIVESLCMWAEDYNIKGFRFDLMGLIDFKTMIEAQKALYKIDKSIYLYGEGWTSGGYHGEGSDEWKRENPIDQWKIEYPDKPDSEYAYNYGAFSWQVYNECNRKKVPDGVYLGGFNDNIRNTIRGENNEGGYPGKGYVQKGNASEAAWLIASGLWGINNNVKSGSDKGDWQYNTGIFPEQTVNYVSCHDNWTVRDQLYNTMTDGAPASATKLIHGTLQAHGLIFASNCAAFMQGGEELLRTKELKFNPNEHPEYNVKPSDCAELHGHWITHNSYNTPAYVNAFVWTNKIKVNLDGVNVNTADGEGGYNVSACFKSLIAAHKALAKKDGKPNDYVDNTTGKVKEGSMEDFYGTTSSGKGVGSIAWGGGEEGAYNSTSIAMQVNETFIYMCAGDQNTEIWGDARMTTTWTLTWDYGGVTKGNPLYFHNLNTIAIFNSNGDCGKL